MPEQILYIVLGWLLGLLSPVIVWLILSRREATAVKSGVLTELAEFRHRMVLTAYIYTLDYGNFDKDFVKWARAHLAKYDGLSDKDGIDRLYNKLCETSDDEFADWLRYQRAHSSSGKGVKNGRLPYLESKLGNLERFSEREQRQLLEILEQVSIYNESANDARYYFNATFDSSISPDNHQTIVSNLEDKYEELGKRARIVADRIAAFSDK